MNVRSAVLVVHATARNADADFERVREAVTARGIALREAHLVSGDRRLRKVVRRAVRSGADAVIVGGGDGTMTKVVGEFAGRNATLAVMPLGTGNSFALTLGIKGIDEALEAIAGGRSEKVDLGTIDGEYFANFVTIGFASTVARRTPRLLKRFAGLFAYVLAGVGPLLRVRPFDCRIKADGTDVRIETAQVLVASGRYFGASAVTPEAGIRSGKLAGFATSDRTPLDVVATYFALLTQTQAQVPNGHLFSAKKMRIRTKPRRPVAIDGMYYGRTPVKLGVAVGALRVLVPAAAHDGEAQ